MTETMSRTGLMTLRELADYLNVSEQFIYVRTYKNARDPIPFVNLGGKSLRFDRAEIDQWVEAKRSNGNGSAA
jgi:excisionase family DNA binding protein